MIWRYRSVDANSWYGGANLETQFWRYRSGNANSWTGDAVLENRSGNVKNLIGDVDLDVNLNMQTVGMRCRLISWNVDLEMQIWKFSSGDADVDLEILICWCKQLIWRSRSGNTNRLTGNADLDSNIEMQIWNYKQLIWRFRSGDANGWSGDADLKMQTVCRYGIRSGDADLKMQTVADKDSDLEMQTIADTDSNLEILIWRFRSVGANSWSGD